MKNIKFLNDVVVKRVLSSENKNIRNYIARMISEVAKIPYRELENKLELVTPEVGYNKNIVNSEADIFEFR